MADMVSYNKKPKERRRMALSNDLRKRIIEASEAGQSVIEIVERFSVGRSTVYDLLKLYKETNSYEPRPHNAGRKPMISEEMLEQIKELIRVNPDVELSVIKEKLSIPVSIPALCKTIRNKLKLRRKKKRYTPTDKIVKMSD
jgi:transposase